MNKTWSVYSSSPERLRATFLIETTKLTKVFRNLWQISTRNSNSNRAQIMCSISLNFLYNLLPDNVSP